MAKAKKAVRKKKTTPTYRSGFEKKTAKYLKEMGVKFEYETVTLEYTVPEKKRRYKPDFILFNGVIVENKGRLDRQTREKMLLAIEQNPDKDIRLLLMRDNYINRGSKTKYSTWCRNHNVTFHISEDGHIPEEWLLKKEK